MTGHDIDSQIDALELAPQSNLLICDVDEVVVHFLRALEAYLDIHDLWLDTVSFALNGNIRRKGDNQPISVSELQNRLYDFFASATASMDAIDGAVDGLTSLSPHAEIVFLTNLPAEFTAARQQNLLSHGLTAPILVNTGPKGPAVKRLAQLVEGTAIFIDDAPSNINSVSDHAPDVNIIHFINDHRFDKLLAPQDGVSLRTNHWHETVAFLQERLLAGPT